MILARILPTLALFALAGSAPAQTHIAIADSTADAIKLLDPFDGSVVDPAFIVDAASATTYDFNLPKDVFQVNNELWVIDQSADSIFRFDLSGAWVATISPSVGMLDNIRGGCFANGVVYVTNDGTNNGATANSVVMFDPAGNRLGQFISGPSPFDVVEYNGELLVADFSDSDIRRHDYAGNLLGFFHVSDGITGIDLVEQLAVTPAGTVLAAGFQAPQGIYE